MPELLEGESEVYLVYDRNLSWAAERIAAQCALKGTMANDARSQLMLYPMQMVWPVAAICLTMLSLHFIGDGLSEALDPRKR